MKGYIQFRCRKCGKIFLVKEEEYIVNKKKLKCPYDSCSDLKYINPFGGIRECMTKPHEIIIEYRKCK